MIAQRPLHHVFRPYSVEEYRDLERNAVDRKHEYCDGEIVAMTGASPEHCTIALNFALALRKRLRGNCRVYASDMRVRTPGNLYAYPDVVAACDPAFDRTETPPVLTNPRVIVEVLSHSTEAFDRGEKAMRYKNILTLGSIVLISQHERLIEQHALMKNGSWAMEIRQRGDSLDLRTLELEIPVDEIYESL